MLHNIPVIWTKLDDSHHPSYAGTIQFNTSGMQGNDIKAKWSTLGSSSVTYIEGGYWWTVEATATLTQGAESTSDTWEKSWSGGYYVPSPFKHGDKASQQYTFNNPMLFVDDYTLEIVQSFADPFTPNSTIALDVESIVAEKPFNFKTLGTAMYKDVIVNFELISNNNVDYRVNQGGIELMSANDISTRQIVIKEGTLKSAEEVTIVVRSHFTFLGQKYYSEWIEYNLGRLDEFEATEITNFRFVGSTKHIEEPMLYAWTNLNPVSGVTNRATFQMYQNGSLRVEATDISNSQVVVPANTLKNTDDIQCFVWNTTTYLQYSASSDRETLNVKDLTSIAPVIEGFTLDSNNRDYTITVTPDATGATSYAIEYANKRYEGLAIPHDTLAKGQCNITLVAKVVTAQGNIVESKCTKAFAIVQDEPTIYSLEPSDLNMNIEQVILVSFTTSDFVDRWELTLPNGLTVRGTDAREQLCSIGTFSKGSNSITLKTYYRDNRTDTRTSTFSGYGVPAQPTLYAQNVYTTAKPTFEWENNGLTDSDIQTSYELEVLVKETGQKHESKTAITADKTYTVVSALENNTEYTFRLRIRNKYDMWSEWLEHNLLTQFTDLPVPTLKLYNNGDNVLIEINADSQPASFQECKIYKREGVADWIEIGDKYNISDTLIDYAIAPGQQVFYKCRLFDVNNAFSESVEISTIVDVTGFNIYDVEDVMGSNITLDFVKPTYKPIKPTVTRVFTGQKPIAFSSGVSYDTGQLTCNCDDAETHILEIMLKHGRVFCLRTWKGKKAYVTMQLAGITPLNRAINSVVIAFTEIEFNETNMYSGSGKRALTYFNGEWFFDAEITFNGEAVIYETIGGE